MSLYLDTSVLVPLHVEEADTPLVIGWLRGAAAPLSVSDLAVAEFASAVSRLVRMDVQSAAVAVETLADFERWRQATCQAVENLPVDIRSAAKLVRTPFPKLLTPDAIHLATCRRLGLTLVTFDRDMLAIAARLGVEALRPELSPP